MYPKITQKLLRRLAPRALRVYERHADKEPGLAAFAASLVVHATAFIEHYDAVREYSSRRFLERKQGKQAIDTVVTKLRIWTPQVARDLTTIKVGDFGNNTDVPEEVIRDAKSLMEHAQNGTVDDEPLAYADALLADLGAAVEAARAQWSEAEAATDGMNELRARARASAVAFERDMVAFRRALVAVIGRTHPDYRKLRIDRAPVADVDDDPKAPPASELASELDTEPNAADEAELERMSQEVEAEDEVHAAE
jgi:hypothetical protein